MKDFVFGLTCFLILYSISFVIVFGTKSLLIYLKILPIKQTNQNKKPKPKRKTQIRSITINPNDVDRIYVKRNTNNSD